MPLAENLPNIAQLQAFRKTGRFDPALKPQKADVMKSARIMGVSVGGDFVGFGRLEIPTQAEIARLTKESVSKSAELNEVFDDSPLLPQWSPEVQPIGVSEVVQKSADVPQEWSEPTPEPLEGIFPTWLQHN